MRISILSAGNCHRFWSYCEPDRTSEGSHLLQPLLTPRTGLEPWLLGLGGGFSLRLLEVHLFSPKHHLFLLSPTQVTWL